jgi:hypothetical protein
MTTRKKRIEPFRLLIVPFSILSLIDKEDEIIPEIIFVQFLIRLAGPIEKPIDIAFVGVIGLRTESPQFDFRR